MGNLDIYSLRSCFNPDKTWFFNIIIRLRAEAENVAGTQKIIPSHKNDYVHFYMKNVKKI